MLYSIFISCAGKHYLVDSGYPTFVGFLGPYKNEKYHLPDFRRASGARGSKEIFNYHHSSLRCTVERTIGVWKKRFQMLKNMRSYPVDIQTKIIIVSMAVRNFIRKSDRNDIEFKPYDEDESLMPNNIDIEDNGNSTRTEVTWAKPSVGNARQMENLRDKIRNQLSNGRRI
jgi:hypothetical protein